MTCIGYPANLAYDYQPLLDQIPLFHFKLNNVGSPFENTPYKYHSKQYERSVLEFFCKLWQFPQDKSWGYVTSSGTEGNLQAFYIARELYPNGVMYFSRASHYSIGKIADMLRIDYVVIDSTESGEIDYNHLEREILKNGDRPALLNATIGTTMTGAIDDTRRIYRIIQKLKKQDEYFLHADGALSGILLPLFEKDLHFKRYIHSISISGHKFLGVPFPCGIFLLDMNVHELLKKKNDADGKRFVAYIDCNDWTVAGSRNGHSSLFLNWILEEKGLHGLEQDATACIERAEYLINKLIAIKVDAWRNHNSITVVLETPGEDILAKWQLAHEGHRAHVIVLPHVTYSIIDEFVADMEKDRKERTR
jgi:histidine decarboxylase